MYTTLKYDLREADRKCFILKMGPISGQLAFNLKQSFCKCFLVNVLSGNKQLLTF